MSVNSIKKIVFQVHVYNTPEGICRLCLCQAHDACSNDLMGSCSWVEPNLCSHCKVMIDQMDEIKSLLRERKKIING